MCVSLYEHKSFKNYDYFYISHWILFFLAVCAFVERCTTDCMIFDLKLDRKDLVGLKACDSLS